MPNQKKKIEDLKQLASEWRSFGLDNLKAETRSGGENDPDEHIIDGHAAVYSRQTAIGNWFYGYLSGAGLAQQVSVSG